MKVVMMSLILMLGHLTAHAGVTTELCDLQLRADHVSQTNKSLFTVIQDFANDGYSTKACNVGSNAVVVGSLEDDRYAFILIDSKVAQSSKPSLERCPYGKAFDRVGTCTICHTKNHPEYNGSLDRYYAVKNGATIVRPETRLAEVRVSAGIHCR